MVTIPGPMVRFDIVQGVAERAGVSQERADRAVKAALEAVKAALLRGERVEIRRFGVFSVRPRKTGMARNPRTGDRLPIPPGRVVRFRPGRRLRSVD